MPNFLDFPRGNQNKLKCRKFFSTDRLFLSSTFICINIFTQIFISIPRKCFEQNVRIQGFMYKLYFTQNRFSSVMLYEEYWFQIFNTNSHLSCTAKRSDLFSIIHLLLVSRFFFYLSNFWYAKKLLLENDQ